MPGVGVRSTVTRSAARQQRSPFVDAAAPSSPRKRSNTGPTGTESPSKKGSFDGEGDDSYFVSPSEYEAGDTTDGYYDDGFGGDYGDDEDSGTESEQEQEYQKQTGWFR